jgi:hypothetical protein
VQSKWAELVEPSARQEFERAHLRTPQEFKSASTEHRKSLRERDHGSPQEFEEAHLQARGCYSVDNAVAGAVRYSVDNAANALQPLEATQPTIKPVSTRLM